jgi:hypothetical protein
MATARPGFQSIAPYPEAVESDALRGGHWVRRRGGIRVWIWHLCDDCGDRLMPGNRCDTCLTWAVKNARDHQWAQMSWANRGHIWDVLELRHERELMSA